MKQYGLKVNGHQYDVMVKDINKDMTLAEVVVNGETYQVEISGVKSKATSRPQVAAAPGSSATTVTPSTSNPSVPRAAAPSAGAGAAIKCPLPGTILSIKVKVGDTVSVGQTLLVLEAMKMENNIDADRSGVVKQILVQQGATVLEGDNLIIIG